MLSKVPFSASNWFILLSWLFWLMRLVDSYAFTFCSSGSGSWKPPMDSRRSRPCWGSFWIACENERPRPNSCLWALIKPRLRLKFWFGSNIKGVAAIWLSFNAAPAPSNGLMNGVLSWELLEFQLAFSWLCESSCYRGKVGYTSSSAGPLAMKSC